MIPDPESLKHFKAELQFNKRLARFVDKIEFFDCFIIYLPGKDQLAADSSSRKPNIEFDKEQAGTHATLFTITEDTLNFLRR